MSSLVWLLGELRQGLMLGGLTSAGCQTQEKSSNSLGWSQSAQWDSATALPPFGPQMVVSQEGWGVGALPRTVQWWFIVAAKSVQAKKKLESMLFLLLTLHICSLFFRSVLSSVALTCSLLLPPTAVPQVWLVP